MTRGIHCSIVVIFTVLAGSFWGSPFSSIRGAVANGLGFAVCFAIAAMGLMGLTHKSEGDKSTHESPFSPVGETVTQRAPFTGRGMEPVLDAQRGFDPVSVPGISAGPPTPKFKCNHCGNMRAARNNPLCSVCVGDGHGNDPTNCKACGLAHRREWTLMRRRLRKGRNNG